MKKFVLIGIGLFVLFGGCRNAWLEVAKNKASAKIDALLGNMEVMRKRIELATVGLKDGLRDLCKTRMVTQVKLEQIEQQVAQIERKLSGTDAALSNVRDHLASQTALKTVRRTYQPEDLQKVATTLISCRKDQNDQLDSLRHAQARLSSVLTALETKEGEYQQRLSKIEGQLVVIDTKRTAVTAMKTAAKAMSDSDAGLAQQVGHLEEQVAMLHAEVEADLRVEGIQFSSAKVRDEVKLADDLVASVAKLADMVRQIDDVLGATNVAATK